MPFDLVVVGGGHNGLVCANYAARAGLSVLVLERHTRVGGAAITETFHPGFRNSTASYTVSLLDPAIVAELALSRYGLRVKVRPMANFVPAVDGRGLALPNDSAGRLAAIAELSPRDAARYPRYAADLDAVARIVRPLWREAPAAPLASGQELARALGIAARTLGAGPAAIASAMRLLGQSAGSHLDAHFEADLLKGALGFDGIVGHFASPYADGSGYVLLHHTLGEVNGMAGAWGHAIGGMGAISDALAAAAVASGVEIRTDTPVERIVPEGDGFVVAGPRGVVTARRVAAAVHPQSLFLSLLEGGDLPASFRQRIDGWQSESASFRINVALAELPDFRCRPGSRAAPHHGAGILIAPSLAYLDRAYETALADGISAAPVIELVIPSVIDDTLAPPGRHVASLFCQHFRYALPGGQSWDDLRAAAVRQIFATVDEYAPNFSRSVLGCAAYSPLDLERRFGLVGGDIFHGKMIRGQLYHARPVRGYARYRTPVPGLYLCASGAHPGGGVTGAPGRNAARAIVADHAAGA